MMTCLRACVCPREDVCVRLVPSAVSRVPRKFSCEWRRDYPFTAPPRAMPRGLSESRKKGYVPMIILYECEQGWKREPHITGAASTREERRRTRETLGAAAAGWKRGPRTAGVAAAAELRAAAEGGQGRRGRAHTGGGGVTSRECDARRDGASGAGRRRSGAEAGVTSASDRREEQGEGGEQAPASQRGMGVTGRARRGATTRAGDDRERPEGRAPAGAIAGGGWAGRLCV